MNNANNELTNNNDNDNDNDNDNENKNEEEIILIQHELCLLSNPNSSLLLNENGENWLRVLFNINNNNTATAATTRTQNCETQFLEETQEMQQQMQGRSTQLKTQIQTQTQIDVDEGNCNVDDGDRISQQQTSSPPVSLSTQQFQQQLKTQPDLTPQEGGSTQYLLKTQPDFTPHDESQIFQNESQLSQQSQQQAEIDEDLLTSVNEESIELITNGTGLSPPNEEESIYLCFEIIEQQALSSSSSSSSKSLTVKDMRPPFPFRGKFDKVASSIIVGVTATATVVVTTTANNSHNNHKDKEDDANDDDNDDDDDDDSVCIFDSIEKQWKKLPRRKLTIVNPNDKISITSSTNTNKVIVFEYQQQRSGTTKQQEQRRNSATTIRNNNHSNSVGVVAGTKIKSSRATATSSSSTTAVEERNNNEADNDDDDDAMDNRRRRRSSSSNSTVEYNTNDFDYGDIHNNINTTYYGTTKTKTKSSGGGGGGSGGSQFQSQPSQSQSQQYSIAVDSVVNTQQESLRNDRIQTLLVVNTDENNENNERDDDNDTGIADGIVNGEEYYNDNDNNDDNDLSTVSGNGHGNCNGINARGIINKNTTTITTQQQQKDRSPPVSFVTTTTTTTTTFNDDVTSSAVAAATTPASATATATATATAVGEITTTDKNKNKHNNSNDDVDVDVDDDDCAVDADVDAVPPKGEQDNDDDDDDDLSTVSGGGGGGGGDGGIREGDNADSNATDVIIVDNPDDSEDDDDDDDDDTVQDYFTQQQQQQQQQHGPLPTITLLSTQPLSTQPEDDPSNDKKQKEKEDYGSTQPKTNNDDSNDPDYTIQKNVVAKNNGEDDDDKDEEDDGDETECAVATQPVVGTSQLLLSMSFDNNNDDDDNINNDGENMDQDTKKMKKKSEVGITDRNRNNNAATTTYSGAEEESTQVPTPTKKMEDTNTTTTNPTTTTTTTTTQITTSKKDGGSSSSTQNSNETIMMTMSPSLMRATGEAIFPADTSSSYYGKDEEKEDVEKGKDIICTKVSPTNSYPAVGDDTQAPACDNTEKCYHDIDDSSNIANNNKVVSTVTSTVPEKDEDEKEDETVIVGQNYASSITATVTAISTAVEEEGDVEVDNKDGSKILSFTAGEKEKETDIGENNECSTLSTARDDTQYAVCETQTQNNNQESKIVDKEGGKVELEIEDQINMMTNVREAEEDKDAETDIGENNESSIPTTAVDGTHRAVCDATTKSNTLELTNVYERDEDDEETVGGENDESSVRTIIGDGTQAAVCETQTLNDDNKEESKNVGKEDELQVDRGNENKSKMHSSLENVGKDEDVKKDNTDQSKMTTREEDEGTEVGEEDEHSFPIADDDVGIDLDGNADDTQGAVCDTLNKQISEIICNATETSGSKSNIYIKRSKPSSIVGDDANEWTSSQHPSKVCAHPVQFKTNAFRKRKHVEEEESSIQEQAPASARNSRRKRGPAKSETLSLVSTSSAGKTRGKGSRGATGNERVEKIVITRNKSETTSARRSTRQREPTASSAGSNAARKAPGKEFEFGADDNHEDEVVNDDETDRYRSPSKRKSLTYSKRDAVGKVASSKIDSVKGRVSDSKRNRKVAASASGGRSSAKRRQVSPKDDDDGGNSNSTTADADERYQKMFAFAIKKNVINIVTSSVLEKDATLIEAFCKKSLNSGSVGIKFVLKDTVDTTTTVCITPANKKDEASQRTLKAIRCSLLGIPMVNPEWIKACKKEGTVVIPTHYVRSLPAKIGKISMTEAKDGVAKLAAVWNDNKFNSYNNNNNDSSSPNLLFHNTDVFLCGSYPPEKKNSLIKLLKDGSANIISTSKDVSLQLTSIVDSSSSSRTDESEYDCSTNDKRKFVLLCGDRGGKALPKYVLTEIKDALESDAEASKFIYVVDSNWVSLSIACAEMLSPTKFKPTSSGIDLW